MQSVLHASDSRTSKRVMHVRHFAFVCPAASHIVSANCRRGIFVRLPPPPPPEIGTAKVDMGSPDMRQQQQHHRSFGREAGIGVHGGPAWMMLSGAVIGAFEYRTSLDNTPPIVRPHAESNG